MTREEWLHAGADALRQHVFPADRQPPRAWLSVGFPKGARGRGKTVGQCWNGALSGDGAPHVFLHPALTDPAAVLAVLTHELVHATVGTEHKHRGAYIELARAVGLVKPWTMSIPSEELLETLSRVAGTLGPYPHAGLDPATPKKTTTRLRLWVCVCDEPVKVRVASDAFDAQCNVCGGAFYRKE